MKHELIFATLGVANFHLLAHLQPSSFHRSDYEIMMLYAVVGGYACGYFFRRIYSERMDSPFSRLVAVLVPVFLLTFAVTQESGSAPWYVLLGFPGALFSLGAGWLALVLEERVPRLLIWLKTGR